MYVVRRELIVPLDLAGVGVERHERAGVEVVALAVGGEIVRAWVAGADKHEVLFRIVGPGRPDRSAAALVRWRPGRPRFPADRIIGTGHSVEAPYALARLRVVCVDHAAGAELGAGRPDDDLVFDDDGRHRRGVADFVVGHRRFPQESARPHVEGNHVRIGRHLEQPIAEHRESSIR